LDDRSVSIISVQIFFANVLRRFQAKPVPVERIKVTAAAASLVENFFLFVQAVISCYSGGLNNGGQ
jgi:hypothetical protein